MNCCDDDDVVASIPIVDLARRFSSAGGSIPDEEHRNRRAAALEAVGDACKNWGFFQVVNHGVGVGSVERMRGAWREFFDLPMEEKELYANSPATYEGYGSRLGVEKDAPLDWGDYYYLNLLPDDTKNLDKWPEMPRQLR
jgi:isopenicillin N synthase-like dioxygenase